MNIIKELTQKLKVGNSFTYSPSRELPKYGYLVVLRRLEHIVPTDNSNLLVESAVRDYIKHAIFSQININGFFMGAMIDDFVVLNLARYFETLPYAISAGREEGEEVIFDITNNKIININA